MRPASVDVRQTTLHVEHCVAVEKVCACVNPLADEPTAAQCRAVARFGRAGLVWIAIAAQFKRLWRA